MIAGRAKVKRAVIDGFIKLVDSRDCFMLTPTAFKRRDPQKTCIVNREHSITDRGTSSRPSYFLTVTASETISSYKL